MKILGIIVHRNYLTDRLCRSTDEGTNSPGKEQTITRRATASEKHQSV